MNLGETIHHLRVRNNLSQEALADALGVSRQSVSKWENGNAIPDLERLVKMAKLFGVTLDELVSGEAPSPVPQEAPKEPRSLFSRRQKAGIGFWCFFVLIVLAMALSGGGLSGMLPGLPFLLCGWLCYGTKLKHIVLWCTWVFALPAIAVPWYEFIRLTEARMILFALWATMLFFTIWTLRKDPVPFNNSTKRLLILGYASWFVWLVLFLLPFFRTGISADPRVAVDTTIAYWFYVAGYLLFISLFSVTTRLLKQMRGK